MLLPLNQPILLTEDFSSISNVKVQIVDFNQNTKIVSGRAQSSNLNKIYDILLMVEQNYVSCICPDFSHRQHPCKHIKALYFVAYSVLFAGIMPSQISLPKIGGK